MSYLQDGVTVKMLFDACLEQCRKGNGDKQILIPIDEEGNDYFQLWDLFLDQPDQIEAALWRKGGEDVEEICEKGILLG